jgi:hypothetical protein
VHHLAKEKQKASNNGTKLALSWFEVKKKKHSKKN